MWGIAWTMAIRMQFVTRRLGDSMALLFLIAAAVAGITVAAMLGGE